MIANSRDLIHNINYKSLTDEELIYPTQHQRERDFIFKESIVYFSNLIN